MNVIHCLRKQHLRALAVTARHRPGGPMQTVASFRSFDRPVQVAILNMLVNNIGFYMLIPFLAGYMANGLGLALWTVGLVLGIRVLSQQGMSLIGGSIGDR